MFDGSFHPPTATRIDIRLVVGAGLFGIGWGLVGLGPGPAMAALTLDGLPVLLLAAAVLAGMALHRWVWPTG